jgi:hypothetical protein
VHVLYVRKVRSDIAVAYKCPRDRSTNLCRVSFPNDACPFGLINRMFRRCSHAWFNLLDDTLYRTQYHRHRQPTICPSLVSPPFHPIRTVLFNMSSPLKEVKLVRRWHLRALAPKWALCHCSEDGRWFRGCGLPRGKDQDIGW